MAVRMTRATVARGMCAAALLLLALAAAHRFFERDVDRALDQDVDPAAATPPAITPEVADAPPDAHQGFLYGRVTSADGATYEGSLRFGGDEETFWDDYFNGFKEENPWAVYAPPELLKERSPIEIFGVHIADRERQIELGRPFMARFGDISRIEARGVDVRVTLKNGTVFDLDRLNASDFDDGVRVWDARRGVVDLDSGVEDVHRRRIDTIELLPTGRLDTVTSRLHGTVHTRQGDFTGFVQWDRMDCLGTDELEGRTADGELGLRFDTIRSIARHSRDSSLVALLDGREIVLSDTTKSATAIVGSTSTTSATAGC